MPSVKGLFDYFSKFEEINTDDLQKWLSVQDDQIIFENRLANRLLYPQVVAQTEADLLFDFSLVREIIKQNITKLYQKNLKRIDIPEQFLEYFPNLQKLAALFIDVTEPSGITTFWMKSDQCGRKNLGTVIRPDNLQMGGFITIGLKEQQYQIETGSLVIIPVPESRADITFTSNEAKLMGKKILITQVITGELGLIIDARITNSK